MPWQEQRSPMSEGRNNYVNTETGERLTFDQYNDRVRNGSIIHTQGGSAGPGVYAGGSGVESAGYITDPQTGQRVKESDYQKKVELMKSQGKNPDGSPIMPGFESQLDPATGLLKSQYQISNNLDKRGIESLRNQALNTGPSAWQTLALQKQGLEQNAMADAARRQSAGAQAEALRGLASHGGLRSGAAERVAMSGSRDLSRALQNVGSQGALARAGIAQTDEENRLKLLSGLPGQELQTAQYGTDISKYNIGGALKDIEDKRAADLARYSEQMKGYAAEKQGAAIRGSGGGGKK